MSFLTLFLWYNVSVHDHENGRKGANMNPIIFWLAAFILFLVMEAATMGLTTIWFAGGSLMALILALLELPT